MPWAEIHRQYSYRLSELFDEHHNKRYEPIEPTDFFI